LLRDAYLRVGHALLRLSIHDRADIPEETDSCGISRLREDVYF